VLLGEWGFVLSVTPAQAELEMHRLLMPTAAWPSQAGPSPQHKRERRMRPLSDAFYFRRAG